MKKAFTLAEVLITLGIIGIVASLTLPSLINKYKEKELINHTKKLYSNLQNAILVTQKDMGVIGDNTFMFDVNKTSAEVAENFAKYFSGAKVCKTSSQKGCSNYFYEIKFATAYSGGGNSIGTYAMNYPKIILNNGAILSLIQYSSCTRTANDCKQDSTGSCIKDEHGNTTPTVATHTNCATIFFDVNGTKRPNQFGADVYGVKVYPKYVGPDYWSAYGGNSFKNILTGKDTLQYINYTKGQQKN